MDTLISAYQPSNYQPSPNEPYMNNDQLAYFKNKLIHQKMQLIEKIRGTIEKIQSLQSVDADILDRSNTQIDIESELKSNQRYNRLIKEIDGALSRIEDGSFGYCELSGEPIGLRRLEVLPFAAMSVKSLEQLETLPMAANQSVAINRTLSAR